MPTWFPSSTFAIFPLNSWQFWLFGLWFLVASCFSFVFPGMVLLNRTKIKKDSQWLLAPIVGIAFWGLQGFILGFLDQIISARWLTYIYLAVFNLIFFKLFFKKFTLFFKKYHNISSLFANFAKILPPVGWILLIIGSVLQCLAQVSSGLMTKDGVVFWWLNAFDGVLHISFIRSLVESMPPIQPGAWNLPITNYHYWSDLIMADLGRIWGVPIIHQYFQYFPILLAPFLGYLSYYLLKAWTKSTTAGLWALFLYFFAGDMMYVFLLLWHGIWGEHTLTIDNGIIQFLNMPQAFAKLVFLGGLLLFHQWQTKKDHWAGWLTMILFATTVGFKVYFGMAAALGLVVFASAQLVLTLLQSKQKLATKIKQFSLNIGLKIALMAGLAATIFFPVNKTSGGMFWTPLEWPKLMLSISKLNWNEWWLRLQVYQAAHNTKALFVWYGMAVVIFLIAAYGTRLIGFLFPKKILKRIGTHNFWFLYPTTLIFTFIGMNFLQVSGLHNIFNFFVISLSILSLLTPVILAEIKPHKIKNSVVKGLALFSLGLFILLSIPRIIITAKFYLRSQAKQFEKHLISPAELEAFSYLLKTNTNLTQTHPYNLLDDYAPYTYIFTGKYNYFGGRGVLKSHNQPIGDRKELIEKLFLTPSNLEARKLMRQAEISHLIYQKEEKLQQPRFLFGGRFSGIMKTAFENEEILILTYGNENPL